MLSSQSILSSQMVRGTRLDRVLMNGAESRVMISDTVVLDATLMQVMPLMH